MQVFDLPDSIARLVIARNQLRNHYINILRERESSVNLRFTLDGNLIGDLGEALAVELFGIQLVNAKSVEGYDGYIPGTQKTVQVKATGTGRGPAFRNTKTHADYLLFFDLDMENAKGSVVYNGPERYARAKLRQPFEGQRSLTAKQIRDAASQIKPGEMISPIADFV
ncbi:MAG: hypothetical protein HWE25_11145 [Alphaproteobacteria bacterium]|nr:hypothetical protein [Alphaproteobacteria bacterium]